MAEDDKLQSGIEFSDYREEISIRVWNFLLKKGYYIADCIGIEICSPAKTCGIGILYKDPNVKPRECFFGLIKTKPRKRFLGVIWLENYMRRADAYNWIFEIYGREYADKMKALAEEMAEAFKVRISVRLVEEQPRDEMFVSDGWM